jgi:ABC-type multidrug transport system fused ATPase/permease subunit
VSGADARRRPRGDLLRALGLLARMSFRADPRTATLVSVCAAVDYATGALVALALKGAADAAAGRDLGGALAAAAGMVATLTAARVANLWGFAAQLRLGQQTGLRMQTHLAHLTAEVPTIEHFERPDYLRELELLRADGDVMTGALSAAVTQIGAVVQLGVTTALLAAVHPLLALLPLFGLPSLMTSARAQRIRVGMREAIQEQRRREWHCIELACTAAPGKELRVFGLGDELLDRHRRARAEADRIEDGGSRRAALVAASGSLVFAVGLVAATAFVADRAAQGLATVGQVVLTLTLAAQVNGQVAGLAGRVSWALDRLKTASRYLWLTEYAAAASRPGGAPAPPPDRLSRGITLEHVAFVYPGTDAVVLDGVSAHLPAGATVALVGENGAGKTSLVKLLCRFYEPTQGRILVDGVDLRRLPAEAWRARTAAAFQDFVRFELLARETVGIGDLPRVEDAVAVGAALEQARAADVVSTLPLGLETPLGRSFDGGAELSIGQWQKLALGRAMMRRTPLLLVLDEPTAALDAPTEHALFERYAAAARRAAAATGGITLLVSHRFSTVRMADVIVVLDGGRVRETGSHEELVAAGGLYAELYELQARAYRHGRRPGDAPAAAGAPGPDGA